MQGLSILFEIDHTTIYMAARALTIFLLFSPTLFS